MGFDESSTIELDMDMYRKWLRKATRGLAYLRVLLKLFSQLRLFLHQTLLQLYALTPACLHKR
jgi:hypothetical protein